MARVPARFVRSSFDRDRLPNGVPWASEYRTDDGTLVYSILYDDATGDIPATVYANSSATAGLIVGTQLLVDVTEVDGTRYATRVAVDEDADYPSCEQCSFMDDISVTTVDAYLVYNELFRRKERAGHWAVVRYDVPEDALDYSSDEFLLEIHCLECRAQFSCRRSGEREAAGVHYRRQRHSFVDF